VSAPSAAALTKLRDNVSLAYRGEPRAVELLLTALLSRGHVLIEDVPGVGKTTLARALGRSLSLDFRRIQFTSDTLPADVIGISVFHAANDRFEFHPGPILAHIVLADEINRATPKTQSALLEAMNESAVTVETERRPLPEPFMVVATQNPIEYEGTFPLPEAQLDRFLLRIHLGYPAPAEEASVLERQMLRHPLEDLAAVTSASELQQLQQAVRSVHVDPQLQRYIVHVVSLTREHQDVYLGASPRGSLALMRASQARAMLLARDYVIPDDVKALAISALAHRLIMSPEARMRNATAPAVIASVLQEVPVPGSRVPA